MFVFVYACRSVERGCGLELLTVENRDHQKTLVLVVLYSSERFTDVTSIELDSLPAKEDLSQPFLAAHSSVPPIIFSPPQGAVV